MKIIQQIIAKAKKDPSVLAVALFGSYARNEPYRDIDICIFLTKRKRTSLQLSKKLLQYTQENEKYDVQIFQHLPLHIKKKVCEDTKVLYCKDEDQLYDIYFQILDEFSHYKPFYESYLEAVAHG